MTILDAIASGQMFKRANWSNFVRADDTVRLNFDDVQATDWVLFAPTITLTQDELTAILVSAGADPKVAETVFQLNRGPGRE